MYTCIYASPLLMEYTECTVLAFTQGKYRVHCPVVTLSRSYIVLSLYSCVVK